MTVDSAIIPVTIIGGFLGAGKTTLLNQLLSQTNAPRCAVLVNDFGEINIDASLIAAQSGDVIALKNGCICCSMGNDLGRALSSVLGFSPQPQRILIEASGVSNPSRIMDVARISKALHPGGIFVLIDSAAILQQIHDRWIADTVKQQLASADVLVTTKLDTLTPDDQLNLFEKLNLLVDCVPMIDQSELGWEGIDNFDVVGKNENQSKTHDEFFSRTLRSSQLLDEKKLRVWLDNTSDVYRFKGWFRNSKNQTKLIQAVDRRIEITECEKEIDDQILAVVIGNSQLASADQIIREIT